MKAEAGERLGFDDYIDDFMKYYPRIDDVFWKLETFQHFEEPTVASWREFSKGNWQESLDLMEGIGTRAAEEFSKGSFERRRLRLVCRPITPYLQWELNVLMHRREAGENVRILLDPPALDSYPEIVILGDQVMYQVMYDDRFRAEGAKKLDDGEVIKGCQEELEEYFAGAEDLTLFFEREVAQLPPPV